MEEKEDNITDNDFDFKIEEDVSGTQSFDLPTHYWKNKYEFERGFWDERLSRTKNENESLKNETAQLKSFLENLTFKLSELEHSYAQDKMLFEQRIELKIKELDSAAERAGYEEKIKKLEKRSIILRRGLVPGEEARDTELNSPSAVIALTSQRIMLDLALEKEALQNKINELEAKLTQKNAELSSSQSKLESENQLLVEQIKKKNSELAAYESKIKEKTAELENKFEIRFKEAKEESGYLTKEKGELSAALALKVGELACENMLIAKKLLDDKKIGREHRDEISAMLSNLEMVSESLPLVSGIMNISRLNLAQESVENIIDDCLGEYLPQILSKNILIEKKYPDIRHNIECDNTLLSNAFKMLITNSVESMLSGSTGKLSISTSYDEINSKAVISVCDTGCGIGADDIAKVSAPFFSKKPNHLGLGLYYAGLVVKLHQGNIFIKSGEGTGTVVEIHLKL